MEREAANDSTIENAELRLDESEREANRIIPAMS